MKRTLSRLALVCLVGAACSTGVSPSTRAGGAVPPTTVVLASTSAPSLTTTTASGETPVSTLTPAGSDDRAVLSASGIADVEFGTALEETLRRLEPMLGQPDLTEPLPSDCYRSVAEARRLTWTTHYLRLVFTDWGGTPKNPQPTPLHLTDWEVIGPGFTTTQGVGWGTTAGELRLAYPAVAIGVNEFAPWFIVETDDGRIMGGFDWPYEEFDQALREALVARGIEVADQPGAGTGQGLLDFMADEGLHDASEVLSVLNLPPPEIPVSFLHAGTGPLCD